MRRSRRICLIATLCMLGACVGLAAEEIELAPRTLLNGRVQFLAPKAFTVMPEAMIKTKYPNMQDRPLVVYTNENATVNVAFTQKKVQRITQDDLPAFLDLTVAAINKQYPGVVWLSKGMEQINGRKVGYLELITPALDGRIYNLMFFTDLDNSVFMGTFNCTEPQRETWQLTALKIALSLKVA